MVKILIVDDSPEALAVARARLLSEPAEILCAQGGLAGLEAAKREKPDLILLDLDMPDVSGLEVCRTLKADPECSLTPIVFLSGSGSTEDIVRGLDLGAVDYVTKPFNGVELRARVRAALRTKRLEDILVEHAHVDPLTGLANRRALMGHLEREWARMKRHGTPLSFVMGDIDHFKNINDTYGHGAGDLVLQETAKTITQQCRKTDLAARYGGEEFAVVVADAAASTASCLAERCRQEIESLRIGLRAATITTTASFGVADSIGLSSLDVLIACADKALYEAKKAGRNAVRVHEMVEFVEPNGMPP